MKKKIFSAIALCVCITLFSAFSTQQNNKNASIIKWDGKELTFKALEDLPLTGLSVVSGAKEYPTTKISNTSGNMKSPNGSTFTPGSSFGGFAGRTFIIVKETTVVCSFNDVSGKATKVYFYLDNGSKMEVNL